MFILKHILFICETSEVFPISREVFKLVCVYGYEHQHCVGNYKPPEELQQMPPERVVHLKNTKKVLGIKTENYKK